ncbi:MAG: DUF479 domain-containing protein [Flavobacteriaceae bacterium]|nr:DUF479 domain-containing protein [Flavobacteriaceae bacterium]
MNYLAHIYLSGENNLLKVGNFMADSVKGNDYLNYPDDLRKGILLHRAIDSFTDANEIYRKSKHRLHENYGHYSGVIMDVLYDHFLAKNWKNFSSIPLNIFIDDFYKTLVENLDVLPEKTKKMVPYLIEQNWLNSYQTISGIERILWQMSHRIKFKVDLSKAAIFELNEFYNEFEAEFFDFMKEIEFMCKEKLKEIG